MDLDSGLTNSTLLDSISIKIPDSRGADAMRRS